MAARPQEQAGMTPAERSRLEALVERWPDDHGDPPDTEYQRGYMAACRDCADELAAELAGAEQETEPCPTISSLASHPITITITDIRPGKLDLPPVDEPTPSPIEPAVHQKQIATDALDPAVVAELERLVDVSASPLNIGDYVCGNWPAILAALRQGTAPATANADAARLRQLCGEVYQVVGVLAERHPDCSASIARVLDNLSAAVEGRPLPHATLLPFVVPSPAVTDAMVEAAAESWFGCLENAGATGLDGMRDAITAALQAQRGE